MSLPLRIPAPVSNTIIRIFRSETGALAEVEAVDPTVTVETYWIVEGALGLALVSGQGRYFVRSVSARGEHQCYLVMRDEAGRELILLKTQNPRWCRPCELRDSGKLTEVTEPQRPLSALEGVVVRAQDERGVAGEVLALVRELGYRVLPGGSFREGEDLCVELHADYRSVTVRLRPLQEGGYRVIRVTG